MNRDNQLKDVPASSKVFNVVALGHAYSYCRKPEELSIPVNATSVEGGIMIFD